MDSDALVWILIAGLIGISVYLCYVITLLNATMASLHEKNFNERHELYARIQAYEVPRETVTNPAIYNREPIIDASDVDIDKDGIVEGFMQNDDGSVYDPITKRSFPDMDWALEWHRFLKRENKPVDFSWPDEKPGVEI